MRKILIALATLAVTGVAGTVSTTSPAAAAQHHRPAPMTKERQDKPFSLESFFVGRLVAQGSFVSRIDGSRRDLVAKMRGSWDGKTLTLVEDFAYADGERDRKTWRFTKVGPGRYVGTREDVIGEATVRDLGGRITLDYTATVRKKDGGAYDLRFADEIVPAGPGRALNTAAVSLLFFPVGDVRLDIRRIGR